MNVGSRNDDGMTPTAQRGTHREKWIDIPERAECSDYDLRRVSSRCVRLQPTGNVIFHNNSFCTDYYTQIMLASSVTELGSTRSWPAFGVCGFIEELLGQSLTAALGRHRHERAARRYYAHDRRSG